MDVLNRMYIVRRAQLMLYTIVYLYSVTDEKIFPNRKFKNVTSNLKIDSILRRPKRSWMANLVWPTLFDLEVNSFDL